MKLLNLLLERLAAPVHVNDEKTLTVIANLIEKEFGVDPFPDSGGICFLSQFIFTLGAVTHIPYKAIARTFSKPTGNRTGHSLADLIKHFSETEIYYDGKTYSMDITVTSPKNSKEVIAEIKKGQPITMIVSADDILYDRLNDVARHEYNYAPHPGEADFKGKTKKVEKGDAFHALLLVGYDEPNDFLIGRDSRSSYGYKGYFRIKGADFDKQLHAMKLLAIEVENLNVVAIGKNANIIITDKLKELTRDINNDSSLMWINSKLTFNKSTNQIVFNTNHNTDRVVINKNFTIGTLKDNQIEIDLSKLGGKTMKKWDISIRGEAKLISMLTDGLKAINDELKST